ncbi:hypothetical protein CTZ27_27530 [Streptomyces griseocarneus]|nr:hypothetical protein CTZ27_27530 [Streptomyces griseocarneus]
MDLLDWHRGSLSSRRLAVLVKHLPRDSAVNRDLHGEAADWDVPAHLLASVVDQLAVANWMTVTLNGDTDADPLDFPEPVQRPGLPGHGPEDTGHAADGEGPGTARERGPAGGMPSPAELARFFGS